MASVVLPQTALIKVDGRRLTTNIPRKFNKRKFAKVDSKGNLTWVKPFDFTCPALGVIFGKGSRFRLHSRRYRTRSKFDKKLCKDVKDSCGVDLRRWTPRNFINSDARKFGQNLLSQMKLRIRKCDRLSHTALISETWERKIIHQRMGRYHLTAVSLEDVPEDILAHGKLYVNPKVKKAMESKSRTDGRVIFAFDRKQHRSREKKLLKRLMNKIQKKWGPMMTVKEAVEASIPMNQQWERSQGDVVKMFPSIRWKFVEEMGNACGLTDVKWDRLLRRYVQFDGQWYSNGEGLCIGSRFSPILAFGVMRFLLGGLTTELRLGLYVDDIGVAHRKCDKKIVRDKISKACEKGCLKIEWDQRQFLDTDIVFTDRKCPCVSGRAWVRRVCRCVHTVYSGSLRTPDTSLPEPIRNNVHAQNIERLISRTGLARRGLGNDREKAMWRRRDLKSCTTSLEYKRRIDHVSNMRRSVVGKYIRSGNVSQEVVKMVSDFKRVRKKLELTLSWCDFMNSHWFKDHWLELSNRLFSFAGAEDNEFRDIAIRWRWDFTLVWLAFR